MKRIRFLMTVEVPPEMTWLKARREIQRIIGESGSGIKVPSIGLLKKGEVTSK